MDTQTIIAVIISDKMHRIEDFMHHYKLPRTGFLKITCRDGLRSLDVNLPIIQIYGDGPEYREMVYYAQHRFKCVRYMDY